MVRQLVAALIGTAAAVTLSGCVGVFPAPARHLVLMADEQSNPPCLEAEEIPVESLQSDVPPTCNPVGSTLSFPDGVTLEIGEGGGGSTSSSRSEYSHSYLNVGDYGIVASRHTAGCEELEVWGSEEAIATVVAAFGQNLGNC